MTRNTSSMAKHLNRHHCDLIKNHEAKKITQIPLASFGNISKPTPMQPVQQEKCANLLALYIATSTAPKNIVESKEFENFVIALNPSFSMPSRRSIDQKIKRLYDNVIEKIKIIVH